MSKLITEADQLKLVQTKLRKRIDELTSLINQRSREMDTARTEQNVFILERSVLDDILGAALPPKVE